MRSALACVLVSISLLHLIAAIGQTENPEKSKDDELSVKRFELMRQRIGSTKISSIEKDFPVQMASKPIFRYSDPARGYVSAAVWKLGVEGRPRALITTELHRRFHGKPQIVYECLSLTSERFSTIAGDIQWSPEGTGLKFKPIPDAQAPEETPSRRLLQMRALAKRFAGNELADKEKCELRLLPQPVDRYTPSSADRSDGAIFLFAFGTNPEVALLIESDGKAWNFAAGRLTGSITVVLTIDGEDAWEGAPPRYEMNQPYTYSSAPVDIPGVAADGSEIRNE